jgi:hypothetical protein
MSKNFLHNSIISQLLLLIIILIPQEKELRLREEEIRIKEALAYAVFQEQFGSKHVPLGIEEKQGKERESFQKDNVQVLDVVLCKNQSTQQVRGSNGSTVGPSPVPPCSLLSTVPLFFLIS